MQIITSPEVLALVPVVLGIVETLKFAGLPGAFAPLFSLMIGVALATLVVPVLPAAIITGLTVGLMASGLYSGFKATAQGLQ